MKRTILLPAIAFRLRGALERLLERAAGWVFVPPPVQLAIVYDGTAPGVETHINGPGRP